MGNARSPGPGFSGLTGDGVPLEELGPSAVCSVAAPGTRLTDAYHPQETPWLPAARIVLPPTSRLLLAARLMASARPGAAGTASSARGTPAAWKLSPAWRSAPRCREAACCRRGYRVQHRGRFQCPRRHWLLRQRLF